MLTGIYESMTPFWFYLAVVILFFLLGLLLGWLVWWAKSQRYDEVATELKTVDNEVSQLVAANERAEKALRSNAATEPQNENGKWQPVGTDAELASRPLALASTTQTPVDWNSIDGVDPKLASEFDALGIKSVDQLESLSLRGSQGP